MAKNPNALQFLNVKTANPGTKGKYAKYDGPVVVRKSDNYVYDGSVMTKRQKQDYDIYHATKGKGTKAT